ncbi:MAG: phospholipase D-like domain-containing protein, partial [Desulfovermiculus sp.]
LVDQASAYYCGAVMQGGANVYLFQEGMLHTKIITIDQAMAIVGSANFDIRSFYLNMELVSIVFDSGFNSHLNQVLGRYKQQSVQVDPGTWFQRPLYKRAAEGMVKIFSPLL